MKFKIHGSFAKKIKGLRLKVLASDFTQKPGLDWKFCEQGNERAS
jgi:hypothetical protein